MTSTTREAATAARKAQITRAAITLLAERGYQATTFEAIRERAGLSSKRLISYHFLSKEELFASVAGQVVAEAEAFIVPAVGRAVGARDRLAAVIRATVAFIASNLDQIRALQRIIENGCGAHDPYHVESVRRLANLFTYGQRTGAFRPCDPRIMATALRASMDSMYPPLSAGLDPELCADELVELFDRACRPT